MNSVRFLKTRSGYTIVWMSITLLTLISLASLAVDLARVQVVKTQLRRAVDAAARYGAMGIGTGNAVAWAQFAASDNSVNGVAFSLAAGDIQTGNYSGGTFTVGGTPLNAIKITGSLTAAKGNAVPLLFGQVIGQNTCNVTAATIGKWNIIPFGLVGINSITTHAYLFVASYDSSSTTTPTQVAYSSGALLYSNGAITEGGSPNNIYGNVQLGPSGSISGISVSGSTTTLGSPTNYPSIPMQVVTNPGGVSATPVINNGQSVTWPGGTYYFTSFTMNDFGTLNFSGPATIYLDGGATIHDSNNIIAYNHIPSNLRIYESSGNTFYIHDSDNIWAQLYAPGSTFTASHDHCNWYGEICAQSVSVHDNDSIYVDTSPTSGTISEITLVK